MFAFCKVFAKQGETLPATEWKLLEVFASIPDLRQDFSNCYPGEKQLTVPVQVVRHGKETLERILCSDLDRFSKPEEALRLIEDAKKAYIFPQIQPEYIILRRKLGGIDIGDYSLSGQKFLSLGHIKGKLAYTPPLLIRLFMGLFGLGFLSRYLPTIWTPFVGNDSTGERQLVEKFIALSRRFLPNLCLSFLHGERVVFSRETQGTVVVPEDS